MKPSWKDAPKWAKYLAMDADGEWWWYEEEPYPQNSDSCWSACYFRRKFAGKTESWLDTLEERPQ